LTLTTDQTQSVVQELKALIGGRIQRIDLINPQLLVLEIRCPGRTFRVLFSAEKNLGRLHLVDRRPPKHEAPTNFQGVLRKFLGGDVLVDLYAEALSVMLVTRKTRLTISLLPSNSPFSIEPHQTAPIELKKTAIPVDFPISDSIAAQYDGRSHIQRESELRQAHKKSLSAQLKKHRRLLKNLNSDRKRLQVMSESRQHGELLKVHLSSIRRGQGFLETIDWEGHAVQIPLDPKLGPKSNLERLFRQAKKADRGLPRVEARIETASETLLFLETEASKLENLSFEALEMRPLRQKQARHQSKKSSKVVSSEPGIRRFKTIDGYEVRVGKGAKDNDHLTLRIARGHDIWLHARGRTGAHVVLKLEKNADPTSEALLDACHLAAFYSDGRNEASLEILYTRAKYVKKIKGAAVGAVNVSKEKTINLRVEGPRLNRLLGRDDLD